MIICQSYIFNLHTRRPLQHQLLYYTRILPLSHYRHPDPPGIKKVLNFYFPFVNYHFTRPVTGCFKDAGLNKITERQPCNGIFYMWIEWHHNIWCIFSISPYPDAIKITSTLKHSPLGMHEEIRVLLRSQASGMGAI